MKCKSCNRRLKKVKLVHGGLFYWSCPKEHYIHLPPELITSLGGISAVDKVVDSVNKDNGFNLKLVGRKIKNNE